MQLEFIETQNSEWRQYNNSSSEYPGIDFVVIKERKEIGREGIYTLIINKVVSIHGPGYMANIFSGGSGENTDFNKDYDVILKKD